jgi:flavin reductase (DIM6/NTAB) family NADH-FMN oxidoreductase RutF
MIVCGRPAFRGAWESCHDVLASLECRIVARHPAGDHVIVVGEVEAGQVRDGRPLLYYRGGYAQLER